MLRRLLAIPTGKCILAAYVLAILAVIVSRLGKLIPYSAYRLTTAVELAVMAIFVLAYLMMWVLLVVGPIRPRSSFTRRGDRDKRVANFLCALGGLLMVHVFLAFMIGTAGA